MNAFEQLARNLERNRLYPPPGALADRRRLCLGNPVRLHHVAGDRRVDPRRHERSRRKAVDARVSPHQFSRDLGAVQDPAINRYVSRRWAAVSTTQCTGRACPIPVPCAQRQLRECLHLSRRRHGASRAASWSNWTTNRNSRGLLGHELVTSMPATSRAAAGPPRCWRRRRSSAPTWLPAIELGQRHRHRQPARRQRAALGYSRDDEREADALGQNTWYAAVIRRPAWSGCSSCWSIRKRNAGHRADDVLTHPMSRERRDTAQQMAETRYAANTKAQCPQRERFMDNTASLASDQADDRRPARRTAMAKKDYRNAETKFESAVKRTPQDYAANAHGAVPAGHRSWSAGARLRRQRAQAPSAGSAGPQGGWGAGARTARDPARRCSASTNTTAFSRGSRHRLLRASPTKAPVIAAPRRSTKRLPAAEPAGRRGGACLRG